MAKVIHKIKGNQYLYEHKRSGKQIVCKYMGPVVESSVDMTQKLVAELKPVKIIQKNGTVFETGKPVSIKYIRNTEKAQKTIDTDRFGQNIEPKGRYMILDEIEGSALPNRWERGTIQFKNPIVLEWGTTSSSPEGWKKRLSEHFGGKTGVKLSKELAKNGYDGIVTVDKCNLSEIVDLTGFQKKRRLELKK